jgi:hypothetical protein
MKKMALAPAVLILVLALPGPSRPSARAAADTPRFDDYFVDKALRVDLYQSGDAKTESVAVRRMLEEPLWPEAKAALLPPFDYGRYAFKVYDAASNRLIFARGFDTMFAEYKTTSPALAGTARVFERSVRFPLPKRPVLFVLEARDKRNLLHTVFDLIIDPADYHILREGPAAGDWIYEARVAGDPHDTVDFVFLAEGYTAQDRDKFKADVDRMVSILLGVEPYKSRAGRISARAVFRPSAERGTDEPRQRSYKATALGASFNAFDLDRYLLVEEDHLLHEIAAEVPYDVLVVLVDSPRYGGGSICLDYCVTTVDHPASPRVFLHELGHSFAYLADEYYQSEVSYNDFYPKGVEPLEPNITALLDPAHVKWADLLSPGVGVPTEYGKDRLEALQAKKREGRTALRQTLEAARKRNASPGVLQALEVKARAAETKLDAGIAAIRAEYKSLEDKVGVFEGAGYASKGLYRPMISCLMIDSPRIEFCKVCQAAIARMIDFTSGGSKD